MSKRRKKPRPPTKAPEFDRLRVEYLIDHINRLPVHEVPDPTHTAEFGPCSYDGWNIAAGKDDLTTGYADLSGVLDMVRDAEDRHAAYVALYRVIYGAFLVAKSGTYPLGEAQYSDRARGRVMRFEKRRKPNARRDTILSAIAEYENEKHSGPRELMLKHVQKRLKEAGFKETIELRQLYRYRGKR
jgi:hypothetical protein